MIPPNTNNELTPEQPLPPETSRIVIILDESGSMKESQQQVISAINAFIDDQKSNQAGALNSLDHCLLTLIKFDTYVNPLWEDIPIQEAQTLTEEHYNPYQGFTALHDAIGHAFQRFGNEKNVTAVIITDGRENASRTHTAEAIKHLIQTHKAPSEYNWSFIYLADSPDLLSQGHNLGINNSHSSSTSSVPFSDLPTFALSLSRQVTTYRRTLKQ